MDSPQDEWLHNRLYILTQTDKDILLSKDEWLNDKLMDAAQKLVCEEIGKTLEYLFWGVQIYGDTGICYHFCHFHEIKSNTLP